MKKKYLPGLSGLITENIYCIGRNYAAHARELNNPVPDRPVIFTKPVASLTFENTVLIPPFVKDPHFETELVAAIGKSGKHIPAENALSYVAGYGLGIDVTARDIQQDLKKNAHPWFLAKGLDTFAPVSSFMDASAISDPQDLLFSLTVNGTLRQSGHTSHMLFPVSELIATLSKYVTLHPGDLIFTGTPDGVGKLYDGDLLHAELDPGLIFMDVQVKMDIQVKADM